MENLLQNFIRQQAKDHILTATLRSNEGEIDFKKLEGKSDAFAALLNDAGCRRGDRIGCMTEKMSSALISMLGIMKAGCVCVPVKSRYSREQIRSVMLETDSRWLLADESVSAPIDPSLFETGEISLGWLGDIDKLPYGVVPEFVFKNIDQYAAKSISGDSGAEKQVFRFILPNSSKPLKEHQVASSAIVALREFFSMSIVKNRFKGDSRNRQINEATNKNVNNQSPASSHDSSNSGPNQREKFIFGFAEESMLSRLKNVGFIREMKDIYLSFWHEVEKENFRRLELQ